MDSAPNWAPPPPPPPHLPPHRHGGHHHKPPFWARRPPHTALTPMGLHLAALGLILLPLVLARKKERPKRQISIWAFDVLKVILAYGLSELLLGTWLYGSERVDTLAGVLPPPNMDGPPSPPPPPTEGEHRGKHGRPPPGPRIKVSTTMLTVRLFEIVPGLLFIYGLYLVLLKLGYLVEKRLIAYLNYRKNPTTSFEDRGRDYGLGYISGNYGNHPLKVGWWAKQTALLTCSVLIIRFLVFEICASLPNGTTRVIATYLFMWIEWIPRLYYRQFIAFVLLPYVLSSAQFVITDYIVKYRRRSRRSAVVMCDIDNDNDDEDHAGSSLELVDLSQTPPTPTSPTAESPTPTPSPQQQPEPHEPHEPHNGSSNFNSFGVVTASILNSAAASATASRIVERSGVGSTTEEEQEGELPPSYDDSQREHEELFSRDRVSALRRAFVIDQMKRAPTSSTDDGQSS